MRLIEADALIEKLEAWKKEAERIGANINYIFASAIIAQVNEQPTIEERKTGKWIVVDDAYNRISGKCSACGWEAHLYEDDVVGMDYCPNCGADMRDTKD